MQADSVLQAETSLSCLVDAIERGLEREIVIARGGHPVARLVPMDTIRRGQRIGVAKGTFEVPDPIDAHDMDVARLFVDSEPS